MPLWSMDEWQYVEREVVTDPKGRRWTVALMDVLGQEGDPEMRTSVFIGPVFYAHLLGHRSATARTRLRIAA
jgi:hypothetical protein